MTPSELAKLRASRGDTQQVAADTIGVSLRTYKRWEHKDGYKGQFGRAFGPSANGLKLIAAHYAPDTETKD